MRKNYFPWNLNIGQLEVELVFIIFNKEVMNCVNGWCKCLRSYILKKEGLRTSLQWKVHLTYPASLQALYTNTWKQIIQIQYNRVKNPNWQKATSWLCTSVVENLDSDNRGQIQQIARAGLEPETAGLWVRWLPPMLPKIFTDVGLIRFSLDSPRVQFLRLNETNAWLNRGWTPLCYPWGTPQTSWKTGQGKLFSLQV